MNAIYIMTNAHRTVLYVGVTSNLRNRVEQHRAGVGAGFVSKYRCHVLVHYEKYESIYEAIVREKQLKKWNRLWKDALISASNWEWNDLSDSL